MRHYKIEVTVENWHEVSDSEAREFLVDLVGEGLNANGFIVEGEVSISEVTHG